MTDISLWRMTSGLSWMIRWWTSLCLLIIGIQKLLSVTLLEGVRIVDGLSRGVYNGEIELNMSRSTKSNTYNRCFRMVSER